MISLRISENIVNLRRKKGITQDELAAFLGVTKASVSKWETKQSCPDILLLPQLATYFDVTIDQLIGYEPQMSPEQISKCYSDLAREFACESFDQAMDKSRKLVKQYYSCYPFLQQVVVLWINHFMLSPEKKVQEVILKDAAELCDHICSSCNDAFLCNEVTVLKAMINLQQGKAHEVIEVLEPFMDPKKMLPHSEGILVQAYQMLGDLPKAELYSQVSIYTHLMCLISSSIGMLSIKMQDYDYCETTIKRMRELMASYDIEKLNTNTALQFCYQCAMFYCVHNELEQAIDELESFVKVSVAFIEKGIALHWDMYFNRMDEWFKDMSNGSAPPRNEKLVMESLMPALENPIFSPLYEDKRYKELKTIIERKIKGV